MAQKGFKLLTMLPAVIAGLYPVLYFIPEEDLPCPDQKVMDRSSYF